MRASSSLTTQVCPRKAYLWVTCLCSLEHSLHPGLSCQSYPHTSVILATHKGHGAHKVRYQRWLSIEVAALCLIRELYMKAQRKVLLVINLSASFFQCLLYNSILLCLVLWKAELSFVLSHNSFPWLFFGIITCLPGPSLNYYFFPWFWFSS